MMSKQSLAIILQTLETTAEALASSATVIGVFRHDADPGADALALRRLREHGVNTIVGYTNPDAPEGSHHVPVPVDHPLAGVSATVLMSDTLCGYVYVDGIAESDDDVEPRLFDAAIGFDPGWTRQVAGHLVDALVAAGLDPGDARLPPQSDVDADESVAAAGWASGMEVLADRLANVSEAWRHEQTLATHDPLTGLSNREGYRRWSGAAAESALPDGPVGVLVFDLDDFKSVNDRLGHDAGDEVLKRVGLVLSRHVRRGDIAVRWGGDEFLLLCPGMASEDELCEIGHRIAAEIATIEVGGMRASVSFGVNVCVERPIVIAPADAAMYRAKRAT